MIKKKSLTSSRVTALFHGTDIEHKNVLGPTICIGTRFSIRSLVLVTVTTRKNIPNTLLGSYPCPPPPVYHDGKTSDNHYALFDNLAMLSPKLFGTEPANADAMQKPLLVLTAQTLSNL